MLLNPLFNPNGNDKEKKVFEGNSTGICQLNDISFPWATRLWDQMRSNFWQHQKIDLSLDVVDYGNLPKAEKTAYNKILGFLVFLDSLQVNNIANIQRAITAPEISMCFAEQSAQEALHIQSYQYIIESVIPVDQRDNIYELWRDDSVLKERCELISGHYQKFLDSPTIDNYLFAIVADYILEGLYFYAGFMFFYNLASRSLMPGTADIIKLIHRDEVSHFRLYQNLILEAKKQYPDSSVWESIPDLFKPAIDNEIKWVHHVCGDNILGITKKSTIDYVNYLANIRLKAIGFTSYVQAPNNPYQHLERFGDLSSEATTKTNFFESTVTSYQTSSTISDWDF